MNKRLAVIAACTGLALAALAGGGWWWLGRDEAPLLVLTTIEEYADTVLCPEDPEYLFDEPLTLDEDDPETLDGYMAQAVRTLERIQPPPELQDFHEVYIDTFRPGADYRAIWDEAEPRLRGEALTELESICFARRERQRAESEDQ